MCGSKSKHTHAGANTAKHTFKFKTLSLVDLRDQIREACAEKLQMTSDPQQLQRTLARVTHYQKQCSINNNCCAKERHHLSVKNNSTGERCYTLMHPCGIYSMWHTLSVVPASQHVDQIKRCKHGTRSLSMNSVVYLTPSY